MSDSIEIGQKYQSCGKIIKRNRGQINVSGAKNNLFCHSKIETDCKVIVHRFSTVHVTLLLKIYMQAVCYYQVGSLIVSWWCRRCFRIISTTKISKDIKCTFALSASCSPRSAQNLFGPTRCCWITDRGLVMFTLAVRHMDLPLVSYCWLSVSLSSYEFNPNMFSNSG